MRWRPSRWCSMSRRSWWRSRPRRSRSAPCSAARSTPTTPTSGKCWCGTGEDLLRRPRPGRARRPGTKDRHGLPRRGRGHRDVRRGRADHPADQPGAPPPRLRRAHRRYHHPQPGRETLPRGGHPGPLSDHHRRQPRLLRLRAHRRAGDPCEGAGRLVRGREHDVGRRRHRQERRLPGGRGAARRRCRRPRRCRCPLGHRPEGRHHHRRRRRRHDDGVHAAAWPPDHLRQCRRRPGRLDVRRRDLCRRQDHFAGRGLRRGGADRRRRRVPRPEAAHLRDRAARRVPEVRLRAQAVELRQPGARRTQAGPLNGAAGSTERRDRDVSTIEDGGKAVLGHSSIFTPEVINDIHVKAELGRYRMRGFSMFKPIPHWDELMFLPGTLTRFVIEGYREKCETKTVLGARFAKHPLELDIPIYNTGMSFGALSLEAKMALAKGASMAGTATCSGEGGMIPPERDLSTKWYYQVIQSRYGFNPHHLMLADGVEFFIGQGCKVGLGGHLMGQKVTEQVAEMRSLPAGIDQRSPARHPDWLGPDDLSLKIQEIREATDYRVPIQLKLGAARVYDDVRMAAKCGPDVIYLDGAEGGTGAGPHVAAEETGIPLMAAIPEARRALEDVGLVDEIDLVVAGGIRNGGDIAKCIALGAKAVAIGHSALMALNCNKEIPGVTDYEGTIGVPAGQCYHCHTGRCPVGITTHDPELRKRLVVEDAAERVYNFLHTLTLEVQMLARACGKTNVHSLEPEDLCALTVEAAAMAKVPLAGTEWIPGVSEERTLAEMKRMLEKHLEYPVDYLPSQVEEAVPD